MANNLVIMESPSKALTVKGYLGSNYKVIASFGHVRDLPKSSLGVDIEHDFDAHYINIRGKGDLIKEKPSPGISQRLLESLWRKHSVSASMRLPKRQFAPLSRHPVRSI